jgi:hypothetical protein
VDDRDNRCDDAVGGGGAGGIKAAAWFYLEPPEECQITDGTEIGIDKDKWSEYAAKFPSWIHNSIKLYYRCQMFSELAFPEAGGVLDQTELIVSILEQIHEVRAKFERKRQRDAEFRTMAHLRRMQVDEYGGGRVRRVK